MTQRNGRPPKDYIVRFRPILAGILSDWTNTVLSLNGLYLVLRGLMSGGSFHDVIYFAVAVIVHIISIEFMTFMAKRHKDGNSKSVLDVMFLSPYLEKDASEHYKSMLTWVALCHLLTILSNLFLILWLVTPAKAGWVAWTHIILPQFSHRNANQKPKNFSKKKNFPRKEKKERRSRKKDVS